MVENPGNLGASCKYNLPVILAALLTLLLFTAMPPKKPAKTRQISDDLEPELFAAISNTKASSRPLGVSGLKPEVFSGLQHEAATAWLEQFKAYVQLNRIHDNDVGCVLRLLINGPAVTWFDSLDPAVKTSKPDLFRQFLDHFQGTQPLWLLEQQLYDIKMGPLESVDSYVHGVIGKCQTLKKSSQERIAALIRGLLPSYKAIVLHVL